MYETTPQTSTVKYNYPHFYFTDELRPRKVEVLFSKPQDINPYSSAIESTFLHPKLSGLYRIALMVCVPKQIEIFLKQIGCEEVQIGL